MKSKHSKIYALLAITGLSAASCGGTSRLDSMRDVQVSEITLEEPVVAEAKLSEKVKRLRADPSKRQELADALAELSLIHNNLGQVPLEQAEAREAAKLLDPCDQTSHAYFVTRRALFFALRFEGKRTEGIVTPLLSGNWSDLDKAQILDDLVATMGPDYSTKGTALKALRLRTNAAGPHSLEVAESLCTYANHGWGSGPGIDKQLGATLNLPPEALIIDDNCERMNERANMLRRRAAQIQEDILGGSSLTLASTLMLLGEKEQLRAIAINEKYYGADSPEMSLYYQSVALNPRNPQLAKLYSQKATVSEGLRQAGADPFKQAYVYVKGSLPEKEREDRKDALTRAFASLGSDPPKMDSPKYGSSGLAWDLDVKKLALPKLERMVAVRQSSFYTDAYCDLLFLDAFEDAEAPRPSLPTWGGDRAQVKVIGKGTILFQQEDPPPFGCQEIEYKWNGKTFEEVRAKAGLNDREVVNSAVDDAVSGIGFMGIRGHHSVDHNLVLNALTKADAVAKELDRRGAPKESARRMRSMFELTSALVYESSTGFLPALETDDSRDDVPKWVHAWTYKGPLYSVSLSKKEWEPFLKAYSQYLKDSGQSKRAEKVTVALAPS